jgi:hypothetical protein
MFEDTSDCLEIASLDSHSGLADGRESSRNDRNEEAGVDG